MRDTATIEENGITTFHDESLAWARPLIFERSARSLPTVNSMSAPRATDMVKNIRHVTVIGKNRMLVIVIAGNTIELLTGFLPE